MNMMTDYIFATVETLNRDDAFISVCSQMILIVLSLDEAHHSSSEYLSEGH